MPALSGSTPIIWGDRIFLNVADALPDTGRAPSLHLWCVDRAKGTILWQKPLGGGNHMQRKQNQSTPSPVTDGTNVWVMTGTGILKAFDFTGKELWSRDIQADYGRFGHELGLRLVAAAARRLALRAGAARHAHRRSVVPPSHRQGDGQDTVAGGAADQRADGIAGCLHDAGAPPDRDLTGDRADRRRRRHRARHRDRQGAVAGRRAQSHQRPELPHRGVAGHVRRSDHRADARAADAGPQGAAAAAT